MSRVGDTLKEARLKANITQKALGKKLGVSEKYINEVETGKRIVQESFIQRVGNILKTNLNEISMVVTDEELEEDKETIKKEKQPSKINSKPLGEVSDVWVEAFSSLLKKVNIYDYSLKNISGNRELPVYSNKIEGYPLDKVLYIKIQDDEMSGFRIMNGDIAFAHKVKEISNNGIFLLEYKGKRIIRQIKTINSSRVLLVSNSGTVQTQTADIINIKPIAKLERLEIKL